MDKNTEEQEGQFEIPDEVINYLMNAETIKSEDIAEYLHTIYDNTTYDDRSCYLIIDEYRGRFYMEFHTLGWSENERLIETVKKNLMFMRFLREYHTGGHYFFKGEFPV